MATGALYPERAARPVYGDLANWVLCWAILPNICMWLLALIGDAPRLDSVFLTGAIGVLIRNRPYWLRCAVLLALMTYSALAFISGLFILPISSLLDSIGFLSEMRPGSSVQYIIAIGLLIGAMAAATVLLRRPTPLDGGYKLELAVAAVFLATVFDHSLSSDDTGGYHRALAGQVPFSSGVSRSGFAAHANGDRHLVLILVESLGVPADPAAQQWLFRRWRSGDIGKRYTVSSGTSPYFGSTTNGEMRALCNRWSTYDWVVAHTDRNCLPARLDRAGYQTTAYHSFDGGLFERHTWYPNIGFENMYFRDDLTAMGASTCIGLFAGVCDREVPALLAKRLKTATRPQFLYWLTLNTHIPVPADAQLHTATCSASVPESVRGYAMICRQFELWDELQDKLAHELTQADFPKTDILIVGDHMPPYFMRGERQQFVRGQVPWVLLHARDR